MKSLLLILVLMFSKGWNEDEALLGTITLAISD
jgi:hypothetical protein